MDSAKIENQDQALDVLKRLQKIEQNIKGIILAAPDGLLVTASVQECDIAEKVSAMSSAICALGKKIGETLKLGGYELVSIKSTTGQIYFFSINSNILTLIATEPIEHEARSIIFSELESLLNNI